MRAVPDSDDNSLKYSQPGKPADFTGSFLLLSAREIFQKIISKIFLKKSSDPPMNFANREISVVLC
jgi:hypothetical protein